ncbi:hypothetical protein [Streptomyces sp. WAC06614]|uniref:hypothetical protein n=1 Tax=Streptomyces sp. WAC06614 TaxID=2487416 RepID=UPI000F78EB2D|nr:hypothetical protein [Streptomyces sp. WAC06614]RSS56162.1 hypothetical protein EF918_34395 [Streptomyces sp. WAC06614]
MHRGLVHAFAWLLATGAAVTLSWWGVRTVMSGTAYDRPLAVPLTARPLSSSTSGDAADGVPPAPSPSPSPSSSASPGPAGSAAAAPSSAASRPAPKPSAGRSADAQPGGDAGEVKGYSVSGGRVVFSLGDSSAELVTATPAGGWRMQVWKQPYWIRVTFSRDGRESSVFCTWHDHAPTVELDER